MAKPHGPLERLLNTPGLPALVPRLAPEVLQRVIQAVGLEDCAEFVALATPQQLARVIDADVWHARAPGQDEAFDPDRFGLWLTVLMEAGAAVAAEKLAGFDIDLVIAGLSRHITVFASVAATPYMTLDGQQVGGRAPHDGPTCELGGCRIEARRTIAWDAIVEVLSFLDAERPEYFQRVMDGCLRASNDNPEQDGFHDLLDHRAQDLFDVASAREARREAEGYAAPAQARAFLREASRLRLDDGRPPESAIARAYFRALEPAALPDPDFAPSDATIVVEALEEAGLLTAAPRGLLGAGNETAAALSLVQAHAVLHPASEGELAYLANTIAAGCSIQGRAFTVREASDCAVATCNLGLESWPTGWRGRDLVTAFQVGWTILHRDVCMHVAAELIEILGVLHCSDRDIQIRLDGLRHALIRDTADGEPWRASEALDVLLSLDAPSWAGLRGLLDECPVIHAAITASRRALRAISPTDFTFISQRAQLGAVREFLSELPSRLAE